MPDMFESTFKRGNGALWVIGAVLLICADYARAVVVGQVDHFQDGTTMGWRHGSPTSPLPPANVPTGGPAGANDAHLLIRTDGNEEGSASRLLALNTAQWQGDYLSAGVGLIQLDARNPNPVDLILRLGFRGAAGSIFVTEGTMLPAGSAWTNISFDLSASNMALASGAYADCFGGVSMMRIVHNPLTPEGDNGEPVRDPAGNPIAAQLGVDNITAVPEPMALSVFVACGLLLQRRRRHFTAARVVAP